jgi:glycosyltransferase XagB
VVQRFAELGPEVACLQGILDYYNTDSNWLSRCFTLEYATWFRVILPGLQRLGLVVPLGGTTLFLRRPAIEQVGGWDAHNVTEDADLGLRLVRHGFRTELIDTVTQEEANARALPWIKQRSRWLKGYAVTWAVHMRNPARLWRDIGPWRFLGVQVLFLGTLSQFVLAPLLWSFWLIPFGVAHPVLDILPGGIVMWIGIFFLFSELIGIVVAAIAARRAGKSALMLWAPTLQFYFILASFAMYKALIEIVTRPYYWDKTVHGIFPPGLNAPPEPLPHPAATG